jgi:hypothetical protein
MEQIISTSVFANRKTSSVGTFTKRMRGGVQ